MVFRITTPAVVLTGILCISPLSKAEERRAQAVTEPNQQLAEQMRILRQELYQELHERQTERVAAIQRELDGIHRDCKRIEDALQAREREFLEWTNELRTTQLSPEERAQAEAAKREAEAEGMQKLEATRASAIAREAELVQRMNREKAKLQRLQLALGASAR